MFARWLKKHRGAIAPTISVVLSIVILVGIAAIVNKEHQSQLEGCERSNDSRVSFVHNLRGDVHTLKAELALWVAAKEKTPKAQWEASPPVVRHAFEADIAALHLGITRKQHAVRTSINAQAEVAIRPGSPVVDCNKAYP